MARSNSESEEWRRGLIQTFLERDIPQLGITLRSTTLRRFCTMLAHYHGQIRNASEFGRSFGVADTTVRNYLDLLTAELVVQQLQPWHENISKRQVKAPKIYIADSGIFHTLLNLQQSRDIEAHPKLGASWEGFIIQQIIRLLDAREEDCFFWATHGDSELDLLILKGGERYGFEVKRLTSQRITPSIRHTLTDLNLTRLDIIHAGNQTFDLSPKICAVSL